MLALRFRPNIVLSGSPAPFDEDYWGDIQIGGGGAGGMVSVVGRCGRCLVGDADVIGLVVFIVDE